MSKAIISSALRVSDYLDKQAIREKEKRKEKILSILPSFIEQQVSGISDKETLYKTIPKLSAELYTYGADVGNAANQILGNIAQTKFREIAEIEEKKGLKDQIGIMEQIGKNLEFEGGKTSTDFLNEMIGKGYDEKTIASMYGNVLESQKIKKTSVGTVDDKGKPIFTSSKYGPSGNLINSETIMFNQTKEGIFADKISTAIKETDPLPLGAIEFFSEQKLKDYEDKKQLNKSIGLAKFNQDYQFKKMEEMDLNKIRALKYYDMNTNEQVKADKDENGTPYFYTEKDEEIVMPGFGMGDTKVKTGKKVRVPVKDVSKLQEIGQFPQNTDLKATDIATQKSISNKFLIDAAQKIAQASGYDTDKALSNLYDATGRYFDPERVRTVFDEYVREELDPALQVKYDAGELTQDEIQQLVSSDTIDEKYAEPLIYWQAYRKSQGLYEQKTDVYNQQSQSRLGQQPTTTTKQKLPGWE